MNATLLRLAISRTVRTRRPEIKALLLALMIGGVAGTATAQRVSDPNGNYAQLYPMNNNAKDYARSSGAGLQSLRAAGDVLLIEMENENRNQLAQATSTGLLNLVNHGGPVILSAQVVAIYWGTYWGTPAGVAIRAQLDGFFGQFGTTPEYSTVTQYTDATGHPILQTSLTGSGSWLDSTNPSNANVTDANLRAEVANYLTQTANVSASAIYEVFLPSGYYASYTATDGSSDSCGGPTFKFCAYHSNFNWNGIDIKYASMPFPDCSGCQMTGWSPQLNLNHFACHETREAVTDPDGTAWYDRKGNEVDDRCAWSPSPFIGTGGYAYQYEWSNAVSGCARTR